MDHLLAATLIAEVGVNMSVFHNDKHLAAWAGICPGNNESAGKRKSSQARKGNILSRNGSLRCTPGCFTGKGNLFEGQVPPPQGA